MMKKLFALLLVLAMVCGLIAGCSSDEQNGNQGSPNSNQNANNDKDANGGNEELSFPLSETYTIEAFAFSNTGEELDKTLTMQVMEEKTNVHWELTTVGEAELEEKRNLSFNGGEYYDVYIKSGISAVDAYKYGSQGVLIPLNDLINAYMPNLKAILDEEELWGEIISADGNIYALPQFNGKGMAAPSSFINQKWLDAVDMDLPTTAEEYMEVLRAFVNKDPNGNGQKDEYGIYCPSGAVEYTLPVFGVAMDYNTYSSYDGENVTYIPTSAEYKEFLAFWAQAYKEGLINQDCFSASWDDINAIGATSDTLGTIPTWGVYQHVGTERDDDYVALMPFNNAYSIPVNSGVQYGALCITDACENPALVCMWADYFYSEEGAILAMMGVEGETYTMDEEGKYHWITDGAWGGDADTIRNTATMYGWYPAPMNWAKLFNEGQADPEELYLYQLRQELVGRAATPFPALSWTEEELAEKATLQTTIYSYYYEYMAQVITGQLDLESSWDTYISNMEAMGVARLNEIDQAAYARWLADHS